MCGLLGLVFSTVGVEARQRGRLLRQQRPKDLAPNEKAQPEKVQPNQPRGNRVEAGEPINEQERRLIPPGVAQPRILIRVFRQLDLTNEQRGRLEALSMRAGNQIPALNRLRRAQSELLDEALYGENFDAQKVDQRASELAATQAEIIKLQARLMSQIRQILTPEQSAKFRSLLLQEQQQQLLPQN
jgi:Spy/CpxP family protein refolding chaperone